MAFVQRSAISVNRPVVYALRPSLEINRSSCIDHSSYATLHKNCIEWVVDDNLREGRSNCYTIRQSFTTILEGKLENFGDSAKFRYFLKHMVFC